jgi:hypothetical protein
MGRKRSTKQLRAAAAARRAKRDQFEKTAGENREGEGEVDLVAREMHKLDDRYACERAVGVVEPVNAAAAESRGDVIVEEYPVKNDDHEVGIDLEVCISCWNKSKLRIPCCKRPICKSCAERHLKSIKSCIACGRTPARYDKLIHA